MFQELKLTWWMGSDMDCSETEEIFIAKAFDFKSRRKANRGRQVYL
jgi:hypothetical protein